MILTRGKSNKKEKGYVLVDVLVTLFVLSIVMTSILSGFTLIGKIVGGAWNRTEQLIQDRNEYGKLPRIP